MAKRKSISSGKVVIKRVAKSILQILAKVTKRLEG
jgi:hypothetical protein